MATPLRLLILEGNPSDAELLLHVLRQVGHDLAAGRIWAEAQVNQGATFSFTLK